MRKDRIGQVGLGPSGKPGKRVDREGGKVTRLPAFVDADNEPVRRQVCELPRVDPPRVDDDQVPALPRGQARQQRPASVRLRKRKPLAPAASGRSSR